MSDVQEKCFLYCTLIIYKNKTTPDLSIRERLGVTAVTIVRNPSISKNPHIFSTYFLIQRAGFQTCPYNKSIQELAYFRTVDLKFEF